MYWPDNEPLPERGQVRPSGSAVVQVRQITSTLLGPSLDHGSHRIIVPSDHQHREQGCGGEAARGLGMPEMQLSQLEASQSLPDVLPLYVSPVHHVECVC